MNHFFALEVPEEVRGPLAEYADRWREQLGEARFRWYAPEDYHLTLKFLGDISPAEAERAAEAARPVSRQHALFAVPLAGPSALPHPERFANVLINGIYSSPDLVSLVKILEQALAAEGFAKELRPYLPHITLARCRKCEKNIEFPEFEHTFLSCFFNRFVLMQTLPPAQRAKQGGVRYNVVHTFPFGSVISKDIS